MYTVTPCSGEGGGGGGDNRQTQCLFEIGLSRPFLYEWSVFAEITFYCN